MALKLGDGVQVRDLLYPQRTEGITVYRLCTYRYTVHIYNVFLRKCTYYCIQKEQNVPSKQ